MKITLFPNEVFSPIYAHLISKQTTEILSKVSPIFPMETLSNFISVSYLPFLKKIWERILILELNYAEKDELLKGASGHERFAFFIHEICKNSNLDKLFNKYPVLERQWNDELFRFTLSLQKMLDRILHDISEVAATLNGDKELINVIEVKPMGDLHRGMQMTSRVSYQTLMGKIGIVYYKPRDLSLDIGFEKFIDWWNGKCEIAHRAPKNIYRGDYGWSESIPHLPCRNEQEVYHFYQRYGSLLALSSIFSTKDMHMENIISCGSYPVLIDLETLFSCLLEHELKFPFKYHIYSSLLLPSHADDNIELSPLTAKAGIETQLDIFINPQINDVSLKMETKKYLTDFNKNQLQLNEVNVDFLRHKQVILQGYEKSAEFIKAHLPEFTAILTNYMTSCQIRILTRSTIEYNKVLYNIYHPDSLYHNLKMKEIYALSSDFDSSEILMSEIDELKLGDVPYFTVNFDGHELRNGNNKIIDIKIVQSPEERVKYQLNLLNSATIERTKKDINFTFIAYILRTPFQAHHSIVTAPIYCKSSNIRNTERWYKSFMQECLDELKNRVCSVDGTYYWRHINIMEEYAIKAGIQSLDLYSGTAGIALTYYYNGLKFNIPKYVEFAALLKRQIAKQLNVNSMNQPGFYCGNVGILYALSLMYKDEQPILLPLLQRELEKVAYILTTTNYWHYSQLDMMSGVAGTLLGLMKISGFYLNYPVYEKIMALAAYAYDIIKSHSLSLIKTDSLLGFSHGSAGVSYAIAEYMNFLDIYDNDAVDIIRHNVTRENMFRTDVGWPDFSANNNCNTSWCHGTTGFGYSRLSCVKFIDKYDYTTDMQLIMEWLCHEQQSFSLCHGLGGSYYFARRSGYPHLARNILNKIREKAAMYGYVTDFGLHNFEMVGAMDGVCGLFVGEQLL